MLAKPLTIGIGSLPGSDIDEAISYSLLHDIPFLPQLVALDGHMDEQLKNKKYSSLKTFKKRVPTSKTIKIQVSGPCSCNVDLEIIKENINHLCHQLKGYKVIIFIDEPILKYSPSLSSLVAYCKERFFKVGLHSCNKDLDAELINGLGIDIISYDYFINRELHTKIDKNISLALGIIHTSESDEVCSIIDKATYISATCGLAYSKKSPQQVIHLLKSTLKKHF